MKTLAHKGKYEMLHFDESSFIPNPPLQYGWSLVGQTRRVEPQLHKQRINVLGALRHSGELIWRVQQKSKVRDDVILLFDCLSDLPHKVPRLVVLDNSATHKGQVMEKKRRQWARKGLYLYYLPAYSPELNRIEILWKQAKHFWRRAIAFTGQALLDEIESLMRGLGKEFTINFA